MELALRDGVLKGDDLGGGLPGPEPLHVLADDAAQQRGVGAMHHLHRLAWYEESDVRVILGSDLR